MATALARYVERSNLPLSIKGTLVGMAKGYDQPRSMLHATGSLIRHSGESIVVGGVLGAVHGMSPQGLDKGGYPIDGGVAVVTGLLSVFAHNSDIHTELKNASSSAAAVFGFRQMSAFTAAKQAHATVAGEDGLDDDEGDFDEDGLLEAARDL